MSNHHLRDPNLSYSAKGLLSFMLALPDKWDYSFSGLVKISKEGKTSIRTMINELKEAKYIKISQSRNEKGFFQYNYDVFEIPFDMPVKTANYPTPENRTSDNRNTENQPQINTNKKIDIYDNIDKTKIPEHHYLTKELFKTNYTIESISEEIRIFYVALTRAKEKIILVYDGEQDSTITPFEINSYRKLVSAVGDDLNKYMINFDISDLMPSEDENQQTDALENILDINRKYDLQEQLVKGEKISSSRASKSYHELLSKNELKNMQLGTRVHEILEYIDYNNPNEILKNEEDWIKKSINKFLSTFIFDNKENNEYYREYAFVYEDEDSKTTYNGIIDLLVETPDKIYIVDYKLNNVEDEAYIKQLSIYEKFVSTKSNKPISTYLYAIINGSFKEINTKEIV